MGMPVKLSDDLVKRAREEAAAAHRSITAQIEHWAKLGRSVESALRHDEARALTRADGDLERAFPGAATRHAVYQLLRRVADEKTGAPLAASLRQGRTVYEADPTDRSRLVRIAPDGSRTAGRLEKRRFVASRPARKRAAG